jgi:hypothetical protein
MDLGFGSRISGARFNGPADGIESPRCRGSKLKVYNRTASKAQPLIGGTGERSYGPAVVRALESDRVVLFWAHSADFSPRRGDPGPFPDASPGFAIESPPAEHEVMESAGRGVRSGLIQSIRSEIPIRTRARVTAITGCRFGCFGK